MNALAPLWQIEDELEALLDSVDTCPEELRPELEARIAAYLESHRERTLQNIAIAGSQDTISYLLVGLAATGHPADRATDAQAVWLMRRQAADGRWPLATLRPPIES